MRTQAILFLAAAAALAPAAAKETDWPVKLSDTSSKKLAALHESLVSPRLEGVQGVPVRDLVWKADAMEIRVKSGAVFCEPPVEGAPIGAFFVGDATAHYAPVADEQRRQLEYWLGRPKLDAEPITSAYFFTLTGSDLLTQLAASGAPTVPFEASAAYADVKQALRRQGLSTVTAFLNREGRSRGTALALVSAPALRFGDSKSSLLMLRHDPTQTEETGVEVYGHGNSSSFTPFKYTFRTVSQQQAASPRFQPQAADVAYAIDLKLGFSMDSAEQTSTVKLLPAPGVRALQLTLTPWLQIQSVRLGERDLPFLQWKRDPQGPILDEAVVVDLGTGLPASQPVELRLKASGALFEPFGDGYFLVEEDTWYPGLSDARSAAYELTIDLPVERTAVAPGRLVELKEDAERRRYVFRTTRPQKASSLYIGKFQSKSGQADATKIEVFVDLHEKNLSFAVVEMQNILKVYNRLFTPLELETLRVAPAPVSHGRGFDGLLLLSSRAGFSGESSGNDIFRAHEVAHQWWGNVVQPDRWPRDRWLSESFAEYASMEYYRARFEDPKKTREAILREWMMPLQKSPETATANLRGAARSNSVAEQLAILDGGPNVYTKGPMVLQMLRYMSSVRTGGDDKFWEILRAFLKEYSGKAATTEDFVEVSQRVLGTDLRWFWSQWLLRTEIPQVRWSHHLEPKDGKWLLTVDARQLDTDFTLLIPVYVHFGDDKLAMKPLLLKERTGKLQVLLPQEPKKVSLNDNFEALVELSKEN